MTFKEIQEELQKIMPTILDVDHSEKLFLNKLRLDTINHLKSQQFSNEEIASRTRKVLFKEYMKILDNKLKINSSLERITPGLGTLLSDQAKTVLLIQEIMEQIEKDFSDHIQNFENGLRKKYKIKSQVSEWLYECTEVERVKLLKTLSFERLKSLIRVKNKKKTML